MRARLLASFVWLAACGPTIEDDVGVDSSRDTPERDAPRMDTPELDAPELDAPRAPDAPAPRVTRVYTAQGDGAVVAFSFGSDGSLSEVGRVSLPGGPGFLDVSLDGRQAVVALGGSSQVVLLDLAAGTGIPSVRGMRRSSEGDGPTHVALDRTGGFALVANYGGGTVASYAVTASGLEPAASTSSPGARAHQIVPSPSNRWMLVPCLGADTVVVLSFDSGSGVLGAGATYASSSGQGPRHLVVSPDGTRVYVGNELRSTVETLTFDDATGALSRLDRLSTLPAGFSGANTVAEIALHPAGHTVYVSNRGHDSIAVFAVEADRTLRLVEHAMLGARRPRSFAIDPSGQWLLAGAQDDDVIVVFRIAADGRLTRTASVPVSGSPDFVGAFSVP